MNEKLNKAISIIAKVTDGQNLTSKEVEKAFTDVFLYDTEGYHYLALCTALHAKGETTEELLGLCKSTEKLSTKITIKVNSNKTTDLSGTGGGKIKTINVSTLASFIVAAAGYTVAKQAMFGITSPTGSADIFSTFGIDVFKLNKKQIVDTLEKVGICPIFNSALSPKLANRTKLARMIYGEKGIKIGAPFNLATFAYSPVNLKKRLYGCYSEKYLKVLAILFSKLGNEKSLIVHGVGGLPEVSNFGETIVVEQNQKKIRKYCLNPSDFGVEQVHVDQIRSGGRQKNIEDFVRIIYGKGTAAKRDLVLVNASTSFFTLNEVDNFKDGTDLARKILEEGKAAKKLEQLVKELGNEKELDYWKTISL